MDELDWRLLEEREVLDQVLVAGVPLGCGDRVRLRPKGRADILDIVLDGKVATIESIEQDYENKVHLAVTVDEDPGRDLGAMKQPGHRFYFSPEEVEPLAPGGAE